MKRLFIIRHGKAETHTPDLTDFERSLVSKGKQRTNFLAKRLQRDGFVADKIISSPALRALSTASLIFNTLQLSSDSFEVNQKLYFGYSNDFLDVILKCDNDVGTLYLVSHNPTVTEFASYFSGDFNDYLRTSGCMGLEFDVDSWSDIKKASGKIVFLEDYKGVM